MPPSAKSSNGRVPIIDYLLLGAVAASPLQRAFTLDLGVPLKLSEVLIVLAALSYPFIVRARGTKLVEGPWVVLLGVVVCASAAYHLLLPDPPGPYPGYTRGVTQDMLLYVAFSLLVVIAWMLVSRMDSERVRKAFVVAVWICIVTTAVQFVLYTAGLESVLKLLNYQTERVGTGFGIDSLRTGPFVEGQHLGFFAGAGLFICLQQRKYAAAAGALACVIYSQSTTALIALIVSAGLLFVIRPETKTQVRLLFGVATFAAAANFIPSVRSFLAFQLAKMGFGEAADTTANDISATTRPAKGGLAWEMATDHPILGIGPGRFGVWFQHYAVPTDFSEKYFNGINRPIVENGYLQLAAEVGIPALLVLGIVLVLLAYRAYRWSGLTFALVVFVAISIATLSSWTFGPLWLILAYVATLRPEAAAQVEPDGEAGASSALSAWSRSRPADGEVSEPLGIRRRADTRTPPDR
jgi:hypothetical protein